jgi:hypothetical protein
MRTAWLDETTNLSSVFGTLCDNGCAAMPVVWLRERDNCVRPGGLCLPRQTGSDTPSVVTDAETPACFKRPADGAIIQAASSSEEMLSYAWIRCSPEDLAKWTDTRCE